ncbi:protein STRICTOSIDINE SYNTHASE-LIKE 3 [Physcomitrium patens]|uniref:protein STRICTOSIDINE SYNTHASE-LIKE 3 n=1 Tax=Physcomitrium patens TaxID=3218 RepID=UPI003CCCE902
MGPLLLIIAVLAWFLASDPLEFSTLSGIDDFHAQYVALPPFNPLTKITPDAENKLQASAVIGTGDIFGPESIVFDAQGKGPYTGLSDGRIVCYDGPELGWSTFATTSKNRIRLLLLRYWIKGPSANTWEVWIDLPGIPDNVRRNNNCEFWVGFHGKRTFVEMHSGAVPWFRHFVAKLPIPSNYLYKIVAPKAHALIVRYSPEGQVLEVLEDQTGKVVKVVSEVEEHDGKLYIGTVLFPQIDIYTLPT